MTFITGSVTGMLANIIESKSRTIVLEDDGEVLYSGTHSYELEFPEYVCIQQLLIELCKSNTNVAISNGIKYKQILYNCERGTTNIRFELCTNSYNHGGSCFIIKFSIVTPGGIITGTTSSFRVVTSSRYKK